MKQFYVSLLGIVATVLPAAAQTITNAPAALVIEAEDFKPVATPGAKTGWKTVFYGQGNYMVDMVGFNHISGERVLSADLLAKNVQAKATVKIPESGTWRIWSRFEQPTNTDNRFRVEVRQKGKLVGTAMMGEKNAPKYYFGSKTPIGQYDASWGSEGLVEQSFDIKNLQAGPAEITLIAVEQPKPNRSGGRANRNVDFLFLSRDLKDSWRNDPDSAALYPFLDAALRALPPRYHLRVTAPKALTVTITSIWNRANWYRPETTVELKANAPTTWIPLLKQDVCHYTAVALDSPDAKGVNLKVELASAPNDKSILRTFNWNDPKASTFQVALPPYPNKYPGERILTVEEQYRQVLNYLKANPTKVGKTPTVPLANSADTIPVWQRGRVGDAAADLFHEIGMRYFAGFLQPESDYRPQVEIARERFKQWKMQPNRSASLGAYRWAPTPENIALSKKVAQDYGILENIGRYDYGDEIGFSEWLGPIMPDDMKARFAAWQRQHKGKVEFATPDSSAAAAIKNPVLYVDSQRFYEETAIEYVANQAKEIPKALGSAVVYGANVGAHPFYYPEIAKYVKWFRKTPSGDYAATYGRHSEYFWQIGLPGPLINGYVADHFRAGMRYNPQSVHQQYTMPHSPGNTDASFRRTAFTHLAHGARGLDYFGIGINVSFTENFIDFRDPARYAAIRDINRSMATIEDILPTSRVVPSKVALILSDSTERWDFAGIAQDKASFDVFGTAYKKMRLSYHQERVGLYYALVHGNRSPDLVTEEDVQNGVLADYDVAYWVGDCIEPAAFKALGAWVENGGQLVATAGAFRFDQYRQPLPGRLALLGLKSAELLEKERFFRPQIELPRLQAIDAVGNMPALAIRDDIVVDHGCKVVAGFKSGKPAVVEHHVGKGAVTYIATLPGVAYIWSAYQPAPGQDYLVAARGPSSHMPLGNFNKDAARWILAPARNTTTAVEAQGGLIDARVVSAPAGDAVVLANYTPNPNTPIVLTIRIPNNIKVVTSAAKGMLPLKRNADGSVTVSYTPGLGDILRIGR